MARLSLQPHLTLDELATRYRACRDPIERTRWHALWRFACGEPIASIERLIGLSDWSIRKTIHRYNAEGPAGVRDKRHDHPGAPSLLAAEQKAELRGLLAGPAPDGGLWTGPKVAVWMGQQLGREVSPGQAWQTLKQLGYSLKRPRRQAAERDEAAQEAFKKRASPPP
jgi:transposase